MRSVAGVVAAIVLTVATDARTQTPPATAPAPVTEAAPSTAPRDAEPDTRGAPPATEASSLPQPGTYAASPYPPGPYYPPPGPYPAPYAAPYAPPPAATGDRASAEGYGAEPQRKKGAYLHDGFYLRLGIGGGLLQTDSTFEGTLGNMPAGEAIGEISYSGAGIALDLAIGGTPVPGFVIAYAFAGQLVHEPTVSISDTPSGDREEPATDSLGVVVQGIAVDVFPDPEKNFEVGGLFGLAFIGTGPEDNRSTGWGGAIWGGYGFWANETVVVSGLLRLAYASTTSENRSVVSNTTSTTTSVIDRSDSTFTVSLIAAMLLH
jgi:hypothetical protein